MGVRKILEAKEFQDHWRSQATSYFLSEVFVLEENTPLDLASSSDLNCTGTG